jgi:hypothetical protein
LGWHPRLQVNIYREHDEHLCKRTLNSHALRQTFSPTHSLAALCLKQSLRNMLVYREASVPQPGKAVQVNPHLCQREFLMLLDPESLYREHDVAA